MEKKLYVRPLGRLARRADRLVTKYVMRWITAEGESPQLTHRWNNTHLREKDVTHLDRSKMVSFEGVASASRRWYFGLPLFHMGFWSDYVVLEPDENTEWHVGWISDRVGISRLPVRGPVRMLLGSAHVMFFGISAKDGVQIRIRQKAIGRIGDGGPFRYLPLH